MRLVVGFGIGVFLISAMAVHASEGIISPLSDEQPGVFTLFISKPAVGFSGLTAPRIGSVLGETSVTEPTPTPLSAEPAEPTATKKARKNSFTITLLGDSMTDTLGPDGAGLPNLLKRSYPGTEFTVINHGVGAENIDSGLYRVTNAYSYLGSGRSSVIADKPDIVVIESFGYNPYPVENLDVAIDTHWLKLAEIIDTIHANLPETKIVIAATIAPNWDVFGDGAPFINFSPEGKRTKVAEIKRYIESTIAFAQGQSLPLADAYHPSLDSSGNGKISYINGGDHIHYSDAGRALFARAVSSAIVKAGLLE